MANTIDSETLSKTVLRDTIRDDLRTAVSNGEINDPRSADRDANMILTAFPSRDVLYPIVVIREANDRAELVDARRDFHRHRYDVQVVIQADNTTHMYQLRDAVRGWFLDNSLELATSGFIDLDIVSSSEMAFNDGARVKNWQFTVQGTVFTADKS